MVEGKDIEYLLAPAAALSFWYGVTSYYPSQGQNHDSDKAANHTPGTA